MHSPARKVRDARQWCRICSALLSSLAAVALLCAAPLRAQQSPLPQPRRSASVAAINNLPDANQQMLMQEGTEKNQNFEAANVARQHQIDDDAVKLLILTRDLKAKMDSLAGRPLSPTMQREAEVIELLARDVAKKMSLAAGAK